MDLVSVCIPTYNGEEYLQQTLDSIRMQTYSNIEVIISDDNSSDSTLEIVKKFKAEVNFPVFIYAHLPSGIGANWNHCVSKANGIFLKFIFQDDYLEPDCIQQMLLAIKATNCSIAICKRNIIVAEDYKKEKEISNWLSIYDDLQKNVNIDKQYNGYNIITKKIFHAQNFLEVPYNKIGEPIVGLIQKEVYQKTGLYNTNIKQFLDYEFWYRALLHYDFVLIEKPLVNFRVHFKQTTKSNERHNVNEFGLYLKFVQKNLVSYIDPRVKKRWFGLRTKLKEIIKRILK